MEAASGRVSRGRVAAALDPQVVWMAAIPLAILAGHLSAISFGGQNGRLLWVDAVLWAGIAWAVARRGMSFAVPDSAPVRMTTFVVVAGAASLLWSRDPLTGIAELKEWFAALGVVAVASVYADRPERARHLLMLVALTGAIVGVMMMIVAATAPMGPVLAVLLKRVDLSWGRSNYLAGILILALPIALGGLGAAASWRERALWFVMLSANAVGLALSASKGAMLMLLIGFLIAYVPAGRAARAGLAFMAIVIAAVSAAFLFGPLNQVLVYRMQESALAYSAGERYDLYELAWESFLSRPLTGVGLNNFSVVANRLTGVDTVPHNFGLGFLAELGAPGALAACAWLLAVLASGFTALRRAGTPRDKSLALGVWCALLAFALHNQVESTIYGEQVKVLLMLVVAAAWAMRRGTAWPEAVPGR